MASELAELAARIEALEARQAQAEAELARLQAIEEIAQLKYRYLRGIDCADLTLLRSTLADNFTCQYARNTFPNIQATPEDFVERMGVFASNLTATWHQVHHPEITVSADGDHATAIWYLQDVDHFLDTRLLLAGTSFYHDRYVRTGDGWKIEFGSYDRMVETRSSLDFTVNYTGHYLKTHGRPRAEATPDRYRPETYLPQV